MADSKYDVKHPNLKGSEQHHDLKDNPGEDGDPNHATEDGSWKKLDDKEVNELKSKIASNKQA